jgi:hypothetical protein
MKNNFIVFDIKPYHGTDFIDRFGSKINLSKETINLAKTIADNTTKLDIASDHQATSIAAASILLAATILKQDINKKSIATIFKISEVTIAKTFNKLERSDIQQIIIDNEKTNKALYKINMKTLTNNFIDENTDDTEDKTEELSTEFDTENKTEDKVEENKSNNIDSETDILIRKLKQSTLDDVNNTTETEEMEISNIYSDDDTIELDETDIIKKDNSQTKINKLIQLQKDKEKRKEEKLRLKQNKVKATKKPNSERSNRSSTSSTGSTRTRGRPRKNIISVSNIVSV